MWVKTALSDRGERNALSTEWKKLNKATLIDQHPLAFRIKCEHFDLGCNLTPLQFSYFENWMQDAAGKVRRQTKDNNGAKSQVSSKSHSVLSDITLRLCSPGVSISPERKENIGTGREEALTMAGLKKPQRAEWRPFSSSSAETRPKKSQAQWTQASEGLHCLQTALTWTIRSILVILPCFHWFQTHNTIYFSYARWLDVG